MNLAAVSSAAVSATSVSPMNAVKVGELDAHFPRKDEDLFLEPRDAAYPDFNSLQDALGGAAFMAQQTGGVVAVSRQGAGYVADPLLQPVWTRTGFGREDALSLAPAHVQVLRAGGSEPEVGFFKLSTDRYGGNVREERTGTLSLHPSSGIDAIVGDSWAYLDGHVQRVTPTYPQQPTPPVDPAPPSRPPVDPAPPTNPGSPARSLVEDITEGLRLAQEAVRIIGTVPPTDRGEESSKETRIKAFKTNMAAQARLERQFEAGNPQDVLSTLRKADASLEDANWQLAKKPSPDGRFNGVDVPGALRDTRLAVDLLGTLLQDLTSVVA